MTLKALLLPSPLRVQVKSSRVLPKDSLDPLSVPGSNAIHAGFSRGRCGRLGTLIPMQGPDATLADDRAEQLSKAQDRCFQGKSPPGLWKTSQRCHLTARWGRGGEWSE